MSANATAYSASGTSSFSIGSRMLTSETQREVALLTERLFAGDAGPQRRSALLAEVGTKEPSSLWLAAGVAVVLARMIGRTVHLLSLSSERVADISSGAADQFVLEYVPEATPLLSKADALTNRLSALAASGTPVIVHLPNVADSLGLVARMGTLEGIVLLIRAAHTRKAEVEAVERQLTMAPMPLLGAVILDREHPIPEKLYRAL
jgi:hypothetical protein